MPVDRLLSLRECVLRFAPYGFRATWHHLIVGAGVPRRLDEDPVALLRAVDEVEQARLVWLAHDEDYAARRRREKAAGRRVPSRADRWRCGDALIAYCPDFEQHPTGRLAVVVRRVIAAIESDTDLSATCRACGRELAENTPCHGCGVDPFGSFGFRVGMHARTAHRWREIWQQTAPRPTR